ncbi:DUF4114 domain-containing protein [Desulfococcaceae bacterium HSG8]|nr:DUF4114 domain-containing protein [Desulfococcaceae bacterium HSG8]
MAISFSLAAEDISAKEYECPPSGCIITEITFNEGDIAGSISLGDLTGCGGECESECTVSMIKARISASGKEPYSDEAISSGPIWTDIGANFEYELPVHIPCKLNESGACSGDPVAEQNYSVSCRVYYSNSGDSYLDLKNQSANVSYHATTPLNFTMTPGYISGTISILGDDPLSGGYIHAYLNSGENYVNTRVKFGDDGKFCFPVQAGENIKLSVNVITTDGNLNLESKYVDVISGETTCADWIFNPGYIDGEISVIGAGTLSEGMIGAYLNSDVNADTSFGSDGIFHLQFPAPNNDITVSATGIRTNTGNIYNLESKSTDVLPGTSAIVNWEIEPQSSILGNFSLNGLVSNILDKHWIRAIGKPGSKGTTIFTDGPYSLTYLLPGEYRFDTASYLNNGDDYFRPPYANFTSPVTVPHDGTVTNHVSSDAAFVNGQINFAPDILNVVTIEDVNSAEIYGHGIENTSTEGGQSRDKVDISNGNYDLILSEGDWNIYHTKFKFNRSQISLCSHDPVYLKCDLDVTDHTRKDNIGKAFTLAPGQIINYNINNMTGAVTFIFKARNGDILKSPWLDGSSEVFVTGQSASIRAWGPSGETTEGEATFIGVPGWYNIKAGAVFNEVSLNFGYQGGYKRSRESSERGVQVVGGEHQIVYVDIYPPSLTMESPVATCRNPLNDVITVSGTASDDIGGIAAITVNGEPVNFSSTNNPDDPNEVSFITTIALDIDSNAVRTVVTDAYGKIASDTRHIFTAGLFTVGPSGLVSTDYLYDGGAYEGELGIFSLSGMERLIPNSGLFIQEAVRRVLSNSADGYIILSDSKEGARLSGPLGGENEEDFVDENRGRYEGMKHFRMRSGDKFAAILIPNDTFLSFSEDMETDSLYKHPIFSLASSNPEFDLHFGQIADIAGLGNAFVYEDQSGAYSDRDYNDLIVQLSGITVCSPTLDALIAPEDDWRNKGLGGQLVEHIEVSPPTPETLWMTIALKSPADLIVYDPQERVIGKEGGTIPGATFETDENGHQIVSLPRLENGDYRIVFHAIGDGGTCHLEVKGYEGEAELLSEEKGFDIESHQVFTTTLSASSFLDNLTIDFNKPEPTELRYDFNADAEVDEDDILKVSSRWNAVPGDQEYDAFYDLDDDGYIGILDIMPVVNSSSVQ